MSDASRKQRFEQANRVDELCDRFEAAWNGGERPRIEDYLQDAAESERPQLLRDLLAAELSLLTGIGQGADEASYCQRFAAFTDVVHDVFHSSAGRRAERLSQISGLSKLSQGSGERVLAQLKDSIAPGREFGSYELLSLLGEGGMGQVWKARHTKLDKLVALKVLSPRVTASSDALARFEREMKAVGRLEHPHIVRALDAGEIDGTHFLVLEYIQGLDLAQYVTKKGKRPLREACEMIRQAALGLHHAHEAGLVHRDIKPSNLFFARTGSIKVLDLGLARLLDHASHRSVSSEGLTEVGQIMGTPDYMAPEQCQSSHSVDLRADLYSLGCTLFCVLAGRAPFADGRHNTPVSKLVGHMSDPIPDLKAARPDTPDDLLAVYQQLMQKRPEDRYQSGQEVADALKAVKENLKRAANVAEDGQDSASGQVSGNAPEGDGSGLAPTVIRPPGEIAALDEGDLAFPDESSGVAVNEPVVRASDTQPLGNDATFPPAGQPSEGGFPADVARDSLPSIQIASATDVGILGLRRSASPKKWLLPGAGAAVLLTLAVLAGGLSRSGNSPEPDSDVVALDDSLSGLEAGAESAVESGFDLKEPDADVLTVPLSGVRNPGEPDADVPKPGVEIGARILHPPAGRNLPVPGKDIPLPDGYSRSVQTSPGQPLNEWATVSRPAPIEGIRSWSIEPTFGEGGGEGLLASCPKLDIYATANGGDPFVRVWDRSGQLKCLLPAGPGVNSLRLSSDGRLLAVGEMGREPAIHGGSGRLRVWDVDSGARLIDQPFGVWVRHLTFSLDGRLIAVPDRQQLVVIDLQSGRQRRFAVSSPQAACFSPGNDEVCVACENAGTPRLVRFSLVADKQPEIIELPAILAGKTRTVIDADWSPDGVRLALIRWNEILILDGGRTLTQRIATAADGLRTVAWHPDSRRLLVNGVANESWNVYDGITGDKLVEGEPAGSYGASWAADGREVMIPGAFRFSAESGQLQWQTSRNGQARGITGLAVAGDALVVANDWHVWKFDAETGQLLQGPVAVANGMTKFSADLVAFARFGYAPTSMAYGSVDDIEQARSGIQTEQKVQQIAWAPDRNTVAIANPDHVIRMHSLPGGAVQRELRGHRDRIVALEWSPAGDRLASLSLDQSIRIWNSLTGDVIRIFTAADLPVSPSAEWGSSSEQALAWTPGGGHLWIAVGTYIVRVDPETGETSDPEEMSMGNVVGTLSLAPDGRQLVMHETYNWTLLRGENGQQRRLIGSRAGRNFAWHPDSRRFVGNPGGRIQSWDTQWHVRLGTLYPQLYGHGESHWLSVSPDGHYRGSEGVESQIVYVAELENGAMFTCPPAEFSERFAWQNDPDRARLLKLDAAIDQPDESDNAPMLWRPVGIGQTGTSTLLPILPGVSTSADKPVDLSITTTVPAVPINISKVNIPPAAISLKGGQPIGPRALVSNPAPIRGLQSWSVELATHYYPNIYNVVFSPTGTRIATTGQGDGSIRIWRLDQSPTGRKLLVHERVLLGNHHQLVDLEWSPDGQTLASLTHRRVVSLFDAGSGRLLRQITAPHANFGGFIAWSPDGRRLATGGPSLIDPSSGSVFAPDATTNCTRGAWSPDGRELVTITNRSSNLGSNYSITRWNGVSLQQLSDQPIEETRGANPCVDWSADGSRIAHLKLSSHIPVRNRSFTVERTIDTSTGVNGVKFAPMSPLGGSDVDRLIATGGPTQVWNARTGEKLLEIPLTSLCADWSADGQWIALGTGSGPMLFHGTTGELLAEVDVSGTAHATRGSLIYSRGFKS